MTNINFGLPYPSITFTSVIFANSMGFFNYIFTEYLKDKNVLIIGKKTLRKEKQQIVIKDPKQIVIE